MDIEGSQETDKVLLFIPAYNCAKQIVRVIRKLDALPAGVFHEILVLDNQSKDDTVQVAMATLSEVASQRVLIARNRTNFGLGGSHKAAFAYAARNGYSHVAVLHGDDQGNILELLPILESGRHRSVDAYLGSRFMSGSKTPGYSTLRIIGNHVFNCLFSCAARQKVSDLGSGLNVFGSAVFTDPDVILHSDDLRFNCYLLLGMIDKGRKLAFFPITWSEEDQVSNVRLVSQTVKTLEIVWEYLLRRERFRTYDHRSVKVDSYDFEVLATSNSLRRAP